MLLLSLIAYVIVLALILAFNAGAHSNDGIYRRNVMQQIIQFRCKEK